MFFAMSFVLVQYRLNNLDNMIILEVDKNED